MTKMVTETFVLCMLFLQHTATSITGKQSTSFRSEARQIVAQAVNAKITGKAACDAVIFAGNGTTGAVDKLIRSLGLHLPLPPVSAFPLP